MSKKCQTRHSYMSLENDFSKHRETIASRSVTYLDVSIRRKRHIKKSIIRTTYIYIYMILGHTFPKHQENQSINIDYIYS